MGEGPEFLCAEGAHGDSDRPLGRPRVPVPTPSCPSYCIPAGLPASRGRDPRTGAPAPPQTEAAQGGPALPRLWVLGLCPGATRPATPEPLDWVARLWPHAPAKRAVPSSSTTSHPGARALAEGDAWGQCPFLPPLPCQPGIPALPELSGQVSLWVRWVRQELSVAGGSLTGEGDLTSKDKKMLCSVSASDVGGPQR